MCCKINPSPGQSMSQIKTGAMPTKVNCLFHYQKWNEQFTFVCIAPVLICDMVKKIKINLCHKLCCNVIDKPVQENTALSARVQSQHFPLGDPPLEEWTIISAAHVNRMFVSTSPTPANETPKPLQSFFFFKYLIYKCKILFNWNSQKKKYLTQY